MKHRSAPLRPAFLVAGLVAAAAIAPACSSVPAGTPVTRIALPNADRVLTTQRRSDWCWAACTEMALRYNGVEGITQEDLVARLKDNAADQRAQDAEIIQALAIRAEPAAPAAADGRIPTGVTIEAAPIIKALGDTASIYAAASDPAVEDLRDGSPVLMKLQDFEGASGHIVFVTAINMRPKTSFVDRTLAQGSAVEGIVRDAGDVVDRFSGDHRYEIVSVEFFDPMPDTGGNTTLEQAALRTHRAAYISRKKALAIVDRVRGSLNVQYR